MDEVFELLLVLIRVTVRLVAQDAPLLDVVVERGARVARGAEPQQARGLGGGQRAAPAQQIEQLRREKGQSASPHRQGGELDSERGDERKVQLARAVEKARQRLCPRGCDVVRAGGAALGRQGHRLNAVVTMDQLERRVVPGDCRHHLEVEVTRERLRLLGIQAVAEAHDEDRDVGVAHREVADVGLDLDDVADELVMGVRVEPVILADVRGPVESRAVDVA